MKLKAVILGVLVALVCFSCDDTTATLGTSLTDNMDHLDVTSDTFKVASRSVAANAVLARNTVSYLGSIRDPETGEYISSNFMTQFHTLEDYSLPEKDSIMSVDSNGDVIADSCEIRLFFSSFYGDSCTSMKLTAYELDRPVPEGVNYYSDFNPKDAGFVREDGMKVSMSYAITDMNVDRSIRDDSDYTKNIRISLNGPYTDKNGVTYNNYGTYIMRKYFENPSYFKNSLTLANNVVPGFYFESSGGLGSMAYIMMAQLNLYFRYKGGSSTSDYTGTTSFSGTEEVLTTTTVLNDQGLLNQLVDDNTCTYIKSPAGIFTELTFPVDEIMRGHENDSINSANVTLLRLNNNVQSMYSFDVPQTLLMIPSDSLGTFFEHKNLPNYKTSYITSYSSSSNAYAFNNIGSLLTAMYHAKQSGNYSENWNKALLIPVTASYLSTSSSSVLTKVSNDMSFTSTRLVGGSANGRSPITINVIYSKYK